MEKPNIRMTGDGFWGAYSSRKSARPFAYSRYLPLLMDEVARRQGKRKMVYATCWGREAR